MIADVQSNANLSLVARVLKLSDPPDFFRQATLSDAGVGIEKHANLFADPAKCLFPIHTKVATYLSRAYFEVQRDNLPQTRRAEIDRRLQQMEEQHKIASDTARIKEVMVAERANTPEAIDQSFNRKLASGAIRPKPDALIAVARHLLQVESKLASYPHSFTARWSFPNQFHNMDSHIYALHNRYPQHKQALFELSEMVGAMSPRQQVERLPEIANKLAEIEPNLIKLQQRLADLPQATEHRIKLATYVFKEGDVERNLCGLHKIASVPLINMPLNSPVAGWQDQLEKLDKAQQQKLADFLLEV